MSNLAAHKTLPLSRIFLILAAIPLIYLLVDFGQQVGASQQQREELKALEEQIALAKEEHLQLEKLLDYARTDAAAEAWARENGMAKPGEVPVVIVAPDAKPTPRLQEHPLTAAPDSPRDAWWDLFFDQR